MPLRLRPIESSDYAQIVPIQFAAFAAEPYHDMLFPGGPSLANYAMVAKMLEKETEEDPTAVFLVVVEVGVDGTTDAGQEHRLDGAEGKQEVIVGAGRWNVYEEPFYPKEGWEDVKADWLEEGTAEREYCEIVHGDIKRKRIRAATGRRGCFLDLLYVDPAHHRRGVGQLIVGWGVKKADELHAMAWLEATQAGMGLYQRNGFQIIEHSVTQVPEKWKEKDKVECWIMEREIKEPARRETSSRGSAEKNEGGSPVR
ncbi:hypothetical protein MMC25_001082 [Agyrium rufum]|nr:hypothetical protein [Agyrium rufum]